MKNEKPCEYCGRISSETQCKIHPAKCKDTKK